jgi:hypothetical protein
MFQGDRPSAATPPQPCYALPRGRKRLRDGRMNFGTGVRGHFPLGVGGAVSNSVNLISASALNILKGS